MNRFGLMMAGSLAAIVLASPATRADPLQDCAEAASAREVSACLARRQREAMRRLEEAREAMAARLAGEDVRALIAEAEAAFDAYVEAGCRVRASVATVDVPPEDLRRDCVIRLLEQRSDELEATLEMLNGD